MAGKPVPAELVTARMKRFQLLVDLAFDGNFSLAARELQMPESTVRQYYRQGPRRVDAGVAMRVYDLLGIPTPWLLAIDSGTDHEVVGRFLVVGIERKRTEFNAHEKRYRELAEAF